MRKLTLRRFAGAAALATFVHLGCGSEGAKPSPSGSGPSSSAPMPSASLAPSGSTPSERRAAFAVRRMADEFPFVSRALLNLPVGGSFFDEPVALGTRRTEIPANRIDEICGGGLPCERDGKRAFFAQPIQEMRTFIRIVAQENESPSSAIDRLKKYLAGFAAPDKGAEYVFGELVEIDSETKQLHVIGARNYVVMGPSPVTEADIQSVTARTEAGPASVEIVLTEAAAARFEKFTSESVYRRIALMVGGQVVAAPIVTAPIPGGVMSIQMGQGEQATDADREQARVMAARLAPQAP